MNKLIAQNTLMSIVASILIACGAATKPTPEEPIGIVPPEAEAPVVTQCTEPRPEMCTMQYLPVCANVAEAPVCKPGMACPAVIMLKKKTYSNSCSACSDPKVRSYSEGECA